MYVCIKGVAERNGYYCDKYVYSLFHAANIIKFFSRGGTVDALLNII